MDWRAGQPDAASDHRRRTVRELSLQRGELPRRCDYGMAYPRLRSDLGGDSRQRYGRDGAGRARDNRRRRRTYQSRRTALARREGGFADVAYHGHHRRWQIDPLMTAVVRNSLLSSVLGWLKRNPEHSKFKHPTVC